MKYKLKVYYLLNKAKEVVTGDSLKLPSNLIVQKEKQKLSKKTKIIY